MPVDISTCTNTNPHLQSLVLQTFLYHEQLIMQHLAHASIIQMQTPMVLWGDPSWWQAVCPPWLHGGVGCIILGLGCYLGMNGTHHLIE